MSAPGSPPLLWDGLSGVSAEYFNYGAQLPWENKAGDWTDALQVPQGTSAYSTLTFHSVGLSTAPITELVKRWYSNGNTGLYLKCLSNTAYVATRTNGDATLRPVVTLSLSDSSNIDLACVASAVANTSSAYPVTGPSVAVQTSSPMVLQFTLVTLGTRTITSATLKLQATKLFGTTTCSVFELRPPKFFGGDAPVLGLADKYPLDSGIANDPNVYFATQFTETGWRTKWFPIGGLASDASVLSDPELQTPALSVTYHTGDFTPCSLDHMWSQQIAGTTKTNAAGTLKTYQQIPPSQYDSLNNQDCPSEVYFRYYLKLLPNYECMVTGKKLPGLAGRYGYWHWSGSNSGYYEPVDGNGGAPTKGTKILDGGYPDGFYYSGWSMRNLAGEAPTDDNPYGSLVVSYTYAYHAAMTGWYGDAWRWGSPELGWVNYALDRWYCIEQYVKLNTLSAPFDSLGNGVGNADGILRCWVDGVLAFEKTDVVFRKHPAIRIDEIWLDHYHGGTVPAEHDHTFEMANLVVASSYIGPMGVAGPVGVPLSVTLLTPQNNASISLGGSFTVTASASDVGIVTKVEYFAGSQSLGSATVAPYTVTWVPAATGTYVLTAVATDNTNLTAISSGVAVTVTAPTGTTVTLQSGLNGYAGVRDTFVNKYLPTTVRGAMTVLYLDSVNYTAMIRFGIFQSEGGPVPNGATIQSAVLELYKQYYDDTIRLNALLKPWVESQATWLLSQTGVPWSTGGAGGAGTDYVTSADAMISVPFKPGWVAFDVTNRVQQWANGNGANYGWRLGATSAVNPKIFDSSEYTIDSTLRPKLMITYH